jgi:hypothetical protein
MRVSELTHSSIADIPEDELVQRLVSPLWRDMFEPSGIPRGMLHKLRVLLKTAPGDFKGDVDILLSSPDRPHEAVAFEVKRIKFGRSALRPGGKPNKLGEFAKAIQQANRLAHIGFWQVYLYVIAVVDAREQNAGKNTYLGLSSELRSLVASVFTPNGLNARVGLFKWEFTQPMDYTPLTVGTRSGHLHRLATRAPQNEELTKWIAEVFSE